jgi:hypothetical protein
MLQLESVVEWVFLCQLQCSLSVFDLLVNLKNSVSVYLAVDGDVLLDLCQRMGCGVCAKLLISSS